MRRRWSQELLERELHRNVLRDSDVWNSLRGGIQRWGGDGSGGGGGALTEMQRSKNAAKESCVAASASVSDIRSLVTVRVGARLQPVD